MANLNQPASGNPGSANVPAPTSNQGAQAGQTTTTGGVTDYSKAYAELETRLGAQGQELGEYKKFFEGISPLLTKLDQSPELAQAIVDGKVDEAIARAVIEGRVDIKDAAVVQQAHDQVKDKLGTAYEAATPEKIEKLVEAQVNKVRKELEEKAELKDFETATTEFIKKTSDFQEYAAEIDKWLDSHEVTDIEVAYYAVKGQLSETAAKKAANEASVEKAKDMVANASGGGQFVPASAADNASLVDRLIAGRPGPSNFMGGGFGI